MEFFKQDLIGNSSRPTFSVYACPTSDGLLAQPAPSIRESCSNRYLARQPKDIFKVKLSALAHLERSCHRPFPEAISALCERLGEGDGYGGESSLNRQDDHLDLVAWKNFPDKLPSKIVMFGQCASGKHWRDKLAELQPEPFWGQWMARAHVSPLVRSFFVPYRIERAWWRYTAGNSGVVFDRCRIAYWVSDQQVDYSPYLEWTKGLLASVSLSS